MEVMKFLYNLFNMIIIIIFKNTQRIGCKYELKSIIFFYEMRYLTIPGSPNYISSSNKYSKSVSSLLLGAVMDVPPPSSSLKYIYPAVRGINDLVW